MMRAALIALLLQAGAAAADAPGTSPRPVARAAADAQGPVAAARDALASSLRPEARRSAPAAPTVVQVNPPVPDPDLGATPRPSAEAPRQRVIRRGRDGEEIVTSRVRPRLPDLRGSVCGDPALRGEAVGAVPGRIPACGIEDAVRVTAVAGVALSQPALMDCPTARALKQWTETSVKPALRPFGRLAGYRVAAHYVCKTRNSRPGARISEHGKGRAIDISAFRLQSGQVITVRTGWRDASTSQTLRRMHKGACGPFGTVLGPAADRFHQGHFHLDTARYRSGPYCR